ncbi:DUF4397 domain-containing protein [Vibrio sp. WXL103]|uniref:DUF4397 domain-containing protein n=1 Tax=Vibrio sp. WXL103 TaxID=3450710 RepID=UPI003EC84FFD
MNKLAIVALVAASATLIGCHHDDDDDRPRSSLQAVHASADAPRANVLLNNREILTGVEYATSSGFLGVNAGTNTVQVDVQLPGDAVTTVIPATELRLARDMRYTVMVIGDAGGENNEVAPLVVERPRAGQADSESLDVQIVHAASGVPDVNVFVTAPDASLNASSPLDTLQYSGFTGVENVPAGQYRVRLQPVGSDAVAFDSGAIDLPAGVELTIAAVLNPDSDGASPVKLMVMDGTDTSIIYDAGETADVRVGHLVDGAPAVDVLANGAPVAGLQGVEFKTVSDYLDLPAGAYDLDVVVAGTEDGLISVEGFEVAAGDDTSIYAVLTTAEPLAIEPLVVSDIRRPVATSAILNVVHAAANPIAEFVDVYLTANASIEGSDPALSNFAYKESVGGVYVEAGTYFLTITVAGDAETVAIGPLEVTVADGVVYQAIAIDDSAGTGFDVLLQDITD